MLFNSIQFVAFFLLVYVAYTILNHRAQNWMLLVASYVFYGAWDWRFLSLLFISTVIDYTVALLLEGTDNPRRRFRYVTLSVCANLGILGVFKYFNFFADSLVHLASRLGLEVTGTTLNIVLPVGISFYTFQTMSYTLDVYRGKLKPTRHFFDFALFVAFFPQLVAGPIERAIHLLPQIINPRRQNLPMFLDGCKLILVGYFKKVVIADNFAVIADRVFNNPDQYSGLAVVFGVYAFAFQIYGDFSGYSDIARGISCLIGIDLMPNFRMPYFSQNPQEFWRRWHISLSSWLRDYLYIPLGGNKYGTAHTYRNLMLTMVLGGLWHGAAWKFVFWGTYQGALLCVHRVFMEWRKNASVLPSPVKMFVFFQLTCFGWVLFRINRIADLPVLMNNMFRLGGVPLEWLASMCFLLAPLLCVEIAEERSGQVDGTAPFHPVVRLLQYAVFVFFICLFGRESGYEFIYFQF